MNDIEKVIQQIYKFVTEVKEQVPEFSDLSDDKQDLKNNEHWVQETEKLLAEFKIDTVQL